MKTQTEGNFTYLFISLYMSEIFSFFFFFARPLRYHSQDQHHVPQDSSSVSWGIATSLPLPLPHYLTHSSDEFPVRRSPTLTPQENGGTIYTGDWGQLNIRICGEKLGPLCLHIPSRGCNVSTSLLPPRVHVSDTLASVRVPSTRYSL